MSLKKLNLRDININDQKLIFHWSNDKDVRLNSINKERPVSCSVVMPSALARSSCDIFFSSTPSMLAIHETPHHRGHMYQSLEEELNELQLLLMPLQSIHHNTMFLE